jgi:hypothetical protein
MYMFWALFCVSFCFDTVSGCKDTNMEALLSECHIY